LKLVSIVPVNNYLLNGKSNIYFKKLLTLIHTGGPYTLFVPTNDAFKLLPSRMLAKWMASPTDLKQLVLAHIVDGNYPLDTLSDNQSLKTKDGGSNILMLTESSKKHA